MPGIGLFLADAPEGTAIGGIVDGGSGIFYSNNNTWASTRFIAAGPYRYISNDSEKTTNRQDALTYFGTSGTDNAEMGYANLNADKDYRLEINLSAADESTNTATLVFTFYTVESEGSLTQVCTFTKTSTLTDVDYSSTAFAFYGYNKTTVYHSFTFELYDPDAENPVKGMSGVYAKNAELTVENGEITSVTLAKTPNDFIADTAEDTVAYLGFTGGFEIGKTLAINWTGKNLPLIGLFLDDAPDGTYIGGLKDAGTGIIYTNCNANWSLYRFIGAGPYRLYSTDSTKTTSRVDSISQMYAYGNTTNNESCELGRINLDASTDYRLEIHLSEADENNNSATLKFTMYTVGTDGALTFVNAFTKTTGTSLADVNYNSTAFAFYGLQRSEYGAVTFSYELYDPTLERAVAGVDNTYAKNATVVASNGAVTSVTLAKTTSNLILSDKLDVDSYIGQTSGFGVGKTLALTWTGKNLPMIGLFLDGAPTGTAIGGIKDSGTGIVLMNWDYTSGRFNGYGPYRVISTGNTTAQNNSISYHGAGGIGVNNNAELSVNNLDASTNYRLEISLSNVSEESNTATITFKFYSVGTDDALTQICTFSFTTVSSLADINYNSTAFAFYGQPRAELGTTTFSYELYDSVEE